jgi:hypothetical protein
MVVMMSPTRASRGRNKKFNKILRMAAQRAISHVDPL